MTTLGPCTPVTTFINGSGPLSDPAVDNYRIQSDGFGAYSNGVAGVVSHFQSIGDYELDMKSSTSRNLLVDLRVPVPPNTVGNAPFAFAYVHGRIIQKCAQLGLKLSDMKGAGTVIYCPFHLGWDDATYNWQVAMNPNNYPETNYAKVTCTRVAGSNQADPNAACNGWNLSNIVQADGTSRNIGKLLRVPLKGQQITVDRGDFYFSFSIDLTNP